MLIKILILFFIFLLFYQTYVFIIENNIFLKENNNVIEGYTDYEETSYMLSQKNAVNIQDLKERIDKITTINNNYDVLNNRLTLVEQKINNLVNNSLVNTKGSNFDTNTVYNEEDEEEKNKKNGLPSTTGSTENTGEI